jgi:hypothetical protein
MLLLPNTTEFKADTEQLCNMVAMQHAPTWHGLAPKFLQNQCFIHAEWSKIVIFWYKNLYLNLL